MFNDNTAMTVKIEAHDCYEKKSDTKFELSFFVDDDKKGDFFTDLTRLCDEYRSYRYD